MSLLAKIYVVDQDDLHLKQCSEKTLIVVGGKELSSKKKTILSENYILLIAYKSILKFDDCSSTNTKPPPFNLHTMTKGRA